MKPILFVLAFIFTLANLADCVTFIMLGDIGAAGDSNPLVVLFGTPIWLLLLKISVSVIPWIAFNNYTRWKTNDWGRFSLIAVVALGIVVMSLGAYTNIVAMGSPEIQQAAVNSTPQEKFNSYALFISIVFIVPLVISILSFKIWELAKNGTC